MAISVLDFLRFSWSLFFDVIKRPAKAVLEIVHLDTKQCLIFGWLCLFVSTALTSLIQIGASGYVLGQLADPVAFADLSKYSGALISGSMDDFKTNLELFRSVSIVNLLFSPLTSWFFPYLLSGALFVLLNFLSLNKGGSDRYEQVIKVVAIGQAPLVFCAIPFIGVIVGNIWCVFFVVRALGALFQVHFLGRLSATCLCFLTLFSIWNSTVSLLATALLRGDWKWIA